MVVLPWRRRHLSVGVDVATFGFELVQVTDLFSAFGGEMVSARNTFWPGISVSFFASSLTERAARRWR